MKYVIVGGNTGGAGAAARLRRLDEQAEILLLEKGAAVSYSNCSLPYRLDQTEKLVLNTPESLHNVYNIETRAHSQAVSIDRAGKKVHIKDLMTGREYDEAYDTLILAPGANAVVPRIQGIENANLFTIKTVADISRFYGFLKESGAKKISVIGGGFIGVETAVNLREAGYQVALVEAMDQILKPYDYDMAQIRGRLGGGLPAVQPAAELGPGHRRGRCGDGGGRPP